MSSPEMIGIPRDFAARLSPVEIKPGPRSESEFARTIKNYSPAFSHYESYIRERKAREGSPTALEVYNTSHDRILSSVILSMEKRLGKHISARNAYLYQPLAASVESLATYCGMNKKADDFNCLTFVNCCLDRLEIAESPETVLPYDAVRAGDIVDFDKDFLDPDKNIAIAKYCKKEVQSKDKRPRAWSEELQYFIGESDMAVRQLIKTKSRFLPLIISDIESILDRPLRKDELYLAVQIKNSAVKIAKKCGLESGKTDVGIAWLVELLTNNYFRDKFETLESSATDRIKLKPTRSGAEIVSDNAKVILFRRRYGNTFRYFMAPYDSKNLPKSHSGGEKFKNAVPLKINEDVYIGVKGSYDIDESYANLRGNKKVKIHPVLSITPDPKKGFHEKARADIRIKLLPDGSIELEDIGYGVSPLTTAVSTKYSRCGFDRVLPPSSLPVPDAKFRVFPSERSSLHRHQYNLQHDVAYADYVIIGITERGDHTQETYARSLSNLQVFSVLKGSSTQADKHASLANHELADSFNKALSRDLKAVPSQLQAAYLSAVGKTHAYLKNYNAINRSTTEKIYGSNLTAMVAKDGRYLLAKIGNDHRAYKISNGKMERVDQANVNAQKLGSSEVLKAQIRTGQLEKGEELLVLSEEIFGSIPLDVINYYLSTSRNIAHAVETISALYNQLNPHKETALFLVRRN